MTMFSNQLNQIWNIISYDLRARGKADKAFGGGAQRSFMTLAGLSMNAIAIWAIVNRRLPESPEDLKEAFSEMFWNAVPIIGRSIVSFRKGWSNNGVVPFYEAVEGLQVFAKALKEYAEKGEIPDYAMRKLWETMCKWVGFPYVGPRRVKKFLTTGNPFELVGGPPTEPKEK